MAQDIAMDTPPLSEVGEGSHGSLTNPQAWSSTKKWLVTLLACYITLLTNLNSTGLTAASADVTSSFNIHSSSTFDNSFWPVTSWTLGAAIVPLFILPMMENYGMRPGYLISWAVFVLFVIPQGVCRNWATMIVTRVIAGGAGGVLQDAMDGIIADIWADAAERSLPVTIYVFCLLSGASLGPVIGGAVTFDLNWRWIIYTQLMIYGASTPLILFFPETRGSILAASARKTLDKARDSYSTPRVSPASSSVNKGTGPLKATRLIKDALLRPTHLLLTEPTLLSLTLLSALSYGLVFTSTQSIPLVYSTLYNFSPPVTALVQSSLVIGETLGFLACMYQNKLFAHAVHKAGSPKHENHVLETRLWICVVGSVFGLAGGLFLYAWLSYQQFPWIAPSLGLVIVGFGSMTTMQAIMAYTTDAYTTHAASASAAVCAGENLFAAFLPLSTQALYTRLGLQWAGSLLGFVALGLAFAPMVLIRWGKSIRGRSRYMVGENG